MENKVKKEKTLHNALDEIKKKSEDKKVDVVLVFYVEEGGKSINLDRIGKPYETVSTLDYIKTHFIDEILGKMVEEQKKKDAKTDISVN